MTLSFAPDAIETWPLSRLQPYAKNAKAHGADQVAKIAASMAEFGWTVPCLVAEDGELIAGQGRVLAATQLGLTEAPVIVLGHLTEAQRRAYRIADNKLTELGTWDEALLSAELNDLLAEDFDLSLVGFSDGELDKLLAYVADDDGGEGGAGGSVPPVTIPEPPRNPASRTGDLWILGDHRLLCGDSTSAADVRRLMNGERAILFATDPPYLVDYDGSNHPTRNKDWSASYGTTWDDSSQGAELYDGFIAAAVAEAITEDAAWYCWHASRRQAMLEACWEKAGAFVHQQIIWVKERGVLTRSHYLWKHEPCFMGWPTPRACSGTRSSGGNRPELLRLWPTPRASANENRQTRPTPSQTAGQHGMNLATTAALWPTPQIDSFRSRGGERKDEKGLDRMARDWPTPMANDGCKPSAGNRRTADLTHAAGMWMTPTARDHKDGATTLANTPVNGLLGRQVLVTPMGGSDTSDVRRTLNPLFVEALMGWPTGWTGFASVATEWSRWLQRMRCELWQLNCWQMDEVAG